MSIELIKENGFTRIKQKKNKKTTTTKSEKKKRKRYPAEPMTDVDYSDELALLANTLVQA